jgi:mono/diheme cytochrome c family protein
MCGRGGTSVPGVADDEARTWFSPTLRSASVSGTAAAMRRPANPLATCGMIAALVAVSACIANVGDGTVRIEPLGGDLAALGRDEFHRACAPCHGVDGRGGGPVAVALRTPPPDLTTLALRNGGRFPHQHLLAVLTEEVAVPAHGSREMPVWSARFGPSDTGAAAAASLYVRRWLEALASYVESLQRRDSAS